MTNCEIYAIQRAVSVLPRNTPFHSFVLEGEYVFVGYNVKLFKTFLHEVVRRATEKLSVLTFFSTKITFDKTAHNACGIS
jgi:hypothetical protein